MRKAFFIFMASLVGIATVNGQDLSFAKKESFLERVAPLITKGELEIYQNLIDPADKNYFEALFWHKRNPEPGSPSNPFRRQFFEKRIIADESLREGDIAGYNSDRGLVFLLLGDPDKVEQKKLPSAGLVAATEEVWYYTKQDYEFHFVLETRANSYVLQDKNIWEPIFEKLRVDLILDRAESYRLSPFTISLPNLGFTRDVENLTTQDRFELDYRADFFFFQGDANRTQVLVGITFKDASNRGMTVHLTAFDPYENKVLDYKKSLEDVGNRMQKFFFVLEPDQYSIVLRLLDKDDRVSIGRYQIDIPRIGQTDPGASSLLTAAELLQIPIEGFREPKLLMFGDWFFPVTNDFSNKSVEDLYLLQYFYNYDSKPEVQYFIDEKPVNANPIAWDNAKNGINRMVTSLPVKNLPDGEHLIKSVHFNNAGDWVVRTVRFNKGVAQPKKQNTGLLAQAKTSDRFTMVHPSKPGAESLERVAIKPNPDLQIKKMHVFLNGTPILEQPREPWQVEIPDGMFSISGKNTISVVLETSEGLLKAEKTLVPFRADENYKSRAVRVYFNAFDEELNFINDLDLKTLKVEVDKKPYKPLDVQKVDGPITYCFLVDNSFSMKDSFGGNQEALNKFIDAMRPEDQGYLISFSDNYHQHNQPTTSKAVMKAVVNSLGLQKPNPKQGDSLYEENSTYLYDAAVSAVHTLLQYPGRKVIVVVSDGIGVEGVYSRNAMLSYARENEVVFYSLFLNNNPTITDDEMDFLQNEMGKGEKFARAIGLSRFFSKKDARKNRIGAKVRLSSINEGILKVLAEASGGFHYQIYRADRGQIKNYIEDIEKAANSQYVMTLLLPISEQIQNVDVYSTLENVAIRAKSEIKVRKTNPLAQ